MAVEREIVFGGDAAKVDEMVVVSCRKCSSAFAVLFSTRLQQRMGLTRLKNRLHLMHGRIRAAVMAEGVLGPWPLASSTARLSLFSQTDHSYSPASQHADLVLGHHPND